MNTGAPWPTAEQAEARVLRMQTKLHQWAVDDPDRRFDDLFNLVCDPAFLVVAWAPGAGATEGRGRPGSTGFAPQSIVCRREEEFLAELRDDLKAGGSPRCPCGNG